MYVEGKSKDKSDGQQTFKIRTLSHTILRPANQPVRTGLHSSLGLACTQALTLVLDSERKSYSQHQDGKTVRGVRHIIQASHAFLVHVPHPSSAPSTFKHHSCLNLPIFQLFILNYHLPIIFPPSSNPKTPKKPSKPPSPLPVNPRQDILSVILRAHDKNHLP